MEEQLRNNPHSDQINQTAADLNKALQEKCEKNGGPGAYDAIKVSINLNKDEKNTVRRFNKGKHAMCGRK